MPQPGTLGAVVDPPLGGRYAQVIRDLQTRVRELETAIPYITASRNFDGSFSPPAVGTSGWGLSAAGDAIFNSIMLRSGSISNSALATALLPGQGFSANTGFAIPVTTGTTRATVSITVPAGYSQAFFLATVNDYGLNSTATSDYLNSLLTVTPPVGSPVAGHQSSPTCGAGEYTSSTVTVANAFTGLSGGSLAVTSAPATSNGSWASNAANSSALSVLVLFVH